MKGKRKILFDELEKIRRRNTRGLLQPKSVVDAARPTNSPLHKYFEWDDGKAAERYRLDQARDLIVRVTIIREEVSDQPFQAFVSLPSNRMGKGGGYRTTDEVMSSVALRQEMLNGAMAEMQNFQERYQRLTELAEVFAAMKKVRNGRKRKAA